MTADDSPPNTHPGATYRATASVPPQGVPTGSEADQPAQVPDGSGQPSEARRPGPFPPGGPPRSPAGPPAARSAPGGPYREQPPAPYQASEGYRQPDAYGQPEPYRQAGAYDQPPAYDQPGTYGQPGAYGHPGAYDQPGAYEQPGAYSQPGTYGQPGGYGDAQPPPSSGAPGYPPAPAASSPWGPPPSGGYDAPAYGGPTSDRAPAAQDPSPYAATAYGSPAYDTPPSGPPATDSDQHFGGQPPFGASAAPQPGEPGGPPAKRRRGLIIGLVLGSVLLLLAIAATGITIALNRSGADFAVDSCVKREGDTAVKANCTEQGAYTVVSKVAKKEDCPDQGEPFVVLERDSGADQVLCLRPATR